MARALAAGQLETVDRPVAQGAGDWTFGLDLETEAVVDAWFAEMAAAGPLSLFSEDSGWRHRGPCPESDTGWQSIEAFDHAGPRIVIDPIDGTRNMMADLRSAWTEIGLAPAGRDEPRLADLRFGLLAELSDSRAARYRVLSAWRGRGARLEERNLDDGIEVSARPLIADGDARADHGYFSFFRYTPAMRPLLAEVEARFFQRIAEREGADVRHCFDDQYISNGGQLALLASGTYRLIADLRASLSPRFDEPITTSKPYDCAGAILIAREAGCVLTAADGGELDFPLDATTPVSFIGYANAGTAERLADHVAAVLDELSN